MFALNKAVNSSKGIHWLEVAVGEILLEIKGVHAGYGNLKILRGIDMEVPTGGIVTLLGGTALASLLFLKLFQD